MTGLDLWLIGADQPADAVARLRETLDAEERARAERAEEPRCSRFTVVRGAVRELVAARLGCRPAEVVWRYGPHGKPEPAGAGGLRVNWSAAGSSALLALAEGRAVGVDVEPLREPRLAERMAARWFPFEEARHVAEAADPAERSTRFTELWCRREACVKAYGGRLTQAFGVSVAGPSPLLLADPGPLGTGPVSLADVPVPGPYRAAVAVLGVRPVQVNMLVWNQS
ncbi:4'-phosphopantetheinyl transferase superfamily protein [Kitasatospora sp. NPDC096077]|uniref:4'-phosphopantetheinyl transferase family protein n=1 Tax=Kitasatospora sp. NPDC096077 TaxID=3155544 RepID=UPI00331DC6E5